MQTELQARVERDREIRARLFDWLDGREVTIDGQPGKLEHYCSWAVYPVRELQSKLWWNARDVDCCMDLTWSERLDGIVRSFGAHYCQDCSQYCAMADPLKCPCCDTLEQMQDEEAAQRADEAETVCPMRFTPAVRQAAAEQRAVDEYTKITAGEYDPAPGRILAP